ncbi:MAG TPA: DNA polymerase [Conexivisphaerales archaeon]|nr:DNA polymerase [Conexivisphaerales archaeon]
MPVFNPITTERRLRRFGVLDLEWVPGESLPELVNTEVEIVGTRERFRVPLPPSRRMTSALRARICGYYDQQPEEGEEDMDEPTMVASYRCYPAVRELVEALLVREYRGWWFFAHAGGLADMQFVLDELLTQIKEQVRAESLLATRSSAIYSPDGSKKTTVEQGMDGRGRMWKIKASFSGSSAIIVHVVSGKNAWHFCDSYWLLRDKLASIGKAIGIKKGDDPKALAWMSERFGRQVKDFESLSRPEMVTFYAEAPIDILTLYNKLDCEILWKAIAEFEAEIVALGGQLQQTIASTAMTLFRRAFLKRDIFTSERLNSISQESYFASRVEVLARNASDFQIYDINSSFPYAMTHPLPANLVEYRTTLPDDDSDSCIYLVDATVEVPDMVLPPLPYRKDNRVFFPTGRWRSWFTSTDIRLALREGATLHKVHEVYVFEPFDDFAAYARQIYALRAASTTDFRKLVLKYLLNSLYGKAAESTHKQEMLVNPDEIDRSTMQMLQPGVWLADKEAKIAHRHVIVASVITAIARRTLYDFAKECYRQDKPPYYFDTDSVSTKATLPTDDKTLGALKLEKKMDWAEFVAPKIYRGEGFELMRDGTWKEKRLTKAKGFSLGQGQAAWDKLDKIIAGDRIGVQRMTRMRELYRTLVGGQYTTSPFELLVIKALTFEMLSKRFHYPDGETRPWTVAELRSGDRMSEGFDFDAEIERNFDTVTKAMLRAAV